MRVYIESFMRPMLCMINVANNNQDEIMDLINQIQAKLNIGMTTSQGTPLKITLE